MAEEKILTFAKILNDEIELNMKWSFNKSYVSNLFLASLPDFLYDFIYK